MLSAWTSLGRRPRRAARKAPRRSPGILAITRSCSSSEMMVGRYSSTGTAGKSGTSESSPRLRSQLRKVWKSPARAIQHPLLGEDARSRERTEHRIYRVEGAGQRAGQGRRIDLSFPPPHEELQQRET